MATWYNRIFHRAVVLFILILSLSLLIPASWLLTTRSGLQYVLSSVFAYTELPIRYQNLQGAIVSGVKADYVEYRSSSLTVEISHFSTNFRLLPLIYKKLAFFDVNAESVKVDLAGSSAKTNNKNVNTPNTSNGGLPISIGIDNVRINNLIVMSPGKTEFEASKVKLRRSKVSNRFEFANLKFDTRFGSLKGSGELGFGELADVKLDTHWTSKKIDNVAAMQGSTEISGSYQNFKLITNVRSPHQLDIRANISDLFSSLTWQATITGQLTPSALLGTSKIPNIDQLNVTSSGSLKQFNFGARGQLGRSDIGYWAFKLDSKTQNGVWTVDHFQLASKKSAALLQGTGTLEVMQENIQKSPISLRLQWRDLNWPIATNTLVHNFKGNATLQGSLQQYQLQISDAAIRVSQQDITGINVSAQGNEQSLSINSFSCRYLSGDIKGKLDLAWAKNLQSKATIYVSAIDPASIFPDWPGKLSTQLSINAESIGDNWNVSANIAQSSGHLNRINIDSASAYIELKQGQYLIRNLNISAGSNKVSGNLHYIHSDNKDSDTLKASWRVNLKDVGKLFPDAAGAINSSGSISGGLVHPVMSMDLTLQNFRFEQYEFGKLRANIGAEMRDSGKLNVKASADNIQIKGNKLQSLALQVTGFMKQHKLILNSQLAKDTGAIRIFADGEYSDEKWRGKITDAAITTSNYGDWQLQQPANLIVASQTVQLQTLCLSDKKQGGVICNQVNVALPNSWAGHTSIKEFPLTGFNVIMPANLRIATGMLSGEINYDINNGLIKLLQADLQSPDGRVNYRQYSGSERLQDYKRLQFHVEHNEKGVQITNRIDLVNTGTMSMRLNLPGMQDISTIDTSQAVEGDVRMDLNNLSLLSLVFPDIQDITGKKHTQFTIAGTIAKPLLVGSSHITAQQLSVPALGVKLTQLDLKANSNTKREIDLSGQVNSGKGSVTLNGSLQDYSADNPTAKIHITGENFLAEKTPELMLEVSPNLTVALKDRKLTLDGEIRVPRANIQQLETSNSLQPSSDLVLVDSEKPEKSPAPELQLSASVRIKIGKEVKIQQQDAIGRQLVGRLEGELLVKVQPDAVSVASGEIRIVDGKYTVYGQELTIETGKLIYSSVPLSQPTLDIEAVKYIGSDVRVGVQIIGPANNLQTKLISTPAMDDSTIMSYLIFGRPYDTATASQQDKSQLVAGAASIVGLNTVTKDLAKELGIDEISVQVDQATQQNILVFGQNLSRNLYLKYITGASQALNALQLEYKLTDKWIFRTETKEQSQGADLFYQIKTK